jgi:threonylcarbamoyladenosine tRNA methylthiotransferase MtaB
VAETVEQAKLAVAAGAREIVLTGVNIGDFGKAHDETLLQLCQTLDALPHLDRFRISSIEPNLLDDDLIQFVAESEKFMPHFHMPLQSGSDRILSAMRRRYRVERYASRVARIRELMPEASIGVDVITGFPGEDEAAFLETFHRLTDWPVSYLHVFTYSERPRTTALRIDDVVPVPVRQERAKQLRALSLKKQRAHYEQFQGQVRNVLLENSIEDGLRFGFTPEYVRVAVPAEGLAGNDLVSVRLDQIHAAGHMSGALVPAQQPLETE